MNVKDEFDSIIRDLQAGKRPRKKWDEDQWREIITTWKAELKAIPDSQIIMQILCLIEHSIPPFPQECQTLILEGLRHKKMDASLIVTMLGVSQKVLFAENYKRGIKVPRETYECLRDLLKVESPEVTEWVLRTLLEAGNEASCMLEDLEEMKIPWFKRITKSQKEIDGLRNKLIERWEKLPRISK